MLLNKSIKKETNMIGEISNTSDILDVRDIITRYETLESDDSRDDSDEMEFQTLSELLANLKGMGGDHQWKGDWYPVTLIHEDYFVEYTEELCKDIGYISEDFPWWITIDWYDTAENIKQDYTEIDYEDQIYLTR